MPLISSPPNDPQWTNPDDVPRQIVAFGMALKTEANVELDLHTHRKGQILMVLRGAFSCEIEGGLWIVPPLSAIWIPGGTLHSKKATGALLGYSIFVDPVVEEELPRDCCVISVTPLLRELLIRAVQLPLFYEESPKNIGLVSLLLGELATARVEDLHLPMPRDLRLRKMVDAMITTPADRSTLEVWAGRVGLSERNLERIISRETGMSFSKWRRQLAVMLAVKWMADGRSIQQVTTDLGYESVPSFVTMFRKTLGTSPARYMAERHFQG